MAERCAGSSILPNTNTVREHLFAPLRCLFALPPIVVCLLDVALRGWRIASGRATRRGWGPKSTALRPRRGASQIVWKIDGAIPHRQRRSPQCNSCFAITPPPATRMAHLRTMARRRFGSSRPTASNSNAATRITIDTYRLANMGQWLASYQERSLSGSTVASQTRDFDRAISSGPSYFVCAATSATSRCEFMVGAP